MAWKTPAVLVAVVCLGLHAGCYQSSPFQIGSDELSTTSRKPAPHPAAGETGIKQVGAQQPDQLPPPAEIDDADATFSTVDNADLPRRRISLVECIALALENGRTGDTYDAPGQRRKSSVTSVRFQSSPSNNSDSIRVFAYEPAIADTETEESLARFDTWAETGLYWNRYDQKSRFLFTPTAFETFTNRNKYDDVIFRSGLYRRLETGGFAGLEVINDHQDNFLGNGTNILNPGSRPSINFLFEQPLLQGAGLYINQIRDLHPGSIRQTLPDASRPPGILLLRISQKQSQLEFERQVHDLVYRVEEAYWQLYGAYWDLFASDNGMKQSYAAWQIAKARDDAGGVGIEDLAMIEEQYHFFRNQRVAALGRGQAGHSGVLEAERLLRFVVGLPAEDGTRLIPSDEPRFLAYDPDLHKSVREARLFRPELRQVEQSIDVARLAIIKGEDRLLPDLRFVSKYDMNGLGANVPAGVENLFTNPHHEWELGLRLQFQLGYRAGNAETARAKLQLMQSLVFYDDQREKLMFSLQRSYRDVIQQREQYKIRQSQRLAAAKQLQARQEKFKAGGDPKQPSSTIDLLLRSQRNWVDAVREELAVLCEYRTAIADFERQKGTILHFANVSITEGGVPPDIMPNASGKIRAWHSKAGRGKPPPAAAELPPMFPAARSLPDVSLSTRDGASFDVTSEAFRGAQLGEPDDGDGPVRSVRDVRVLAPAGDDLVKVGDLRSKPPAPDAGTAPDADAAPVLSAPTASPDFVPPAPDPGLRRPEE